MPEHISFHLSGHNRVIEAPNKCPLCHHIILIKEAVSYLSNEDELQFVFKCPNYECNHFFIGYYKRESDTSFPLKSFKPVNTIIPNFSDCISTLSISFINIYREAETANQLGLSQIAGAGYRKAFEFLIKDYAKSLAKEEQYSEIEKCFAGNVVQNYISDKRIQSVAKRALWLGNDETHYLRKWSEKDFNDLITLINLTIHWIEIEKISADYIEDMPEQKKGEKNE